MGSESGAVCLIDDREGSQKLSVVTQAAFAVTSLAVDFDREVVWIGGRGRKIQRLSFDFIRSSSASTPMSPARSEKSPVDKKSKVPAITCMGSLSSHLITVEATREIQIYTVNTLRDECEQEHGETSMAAHRDPILGVRRLEAANAFSADFFSWSRSGTVNFWDIRGKRLRSNTIGLDLNFGVEDDVTNELKVLRAGSNAEWFVSGDKFGVLRFV